MSDTSVRLPGLRDRVVRRLRDGVRARAAAYLPQLVDRFPPVTVATGPAVPGWLVRLVTGGLAVAALGTVRPGPYLWVLLGALVVALVLVPGRLLPPVTAAAVGLLLILTGTQPSVPRTAFLVLVLPVMAQLGLIAGQVGLAGRIELRVLLAPARRLLVVQLVAQPVALLGSLLAGAHLDVTLLPVIAGLGLVVLVLLWAPTLGDAPRD